MRDNLSSVKVVELRELYASHIIQMKGLKKAELISALNAHLMPDSGSKEDDHIEVVDICNESLSTESSCSRNENARDLSSLKVKQLRDLCAEQDIDFMGLNKADLIAALNRASVEEIEDVSSCASIVSLNFKDMKVA